MVRVFDVLGFFQCVRVSNVSEFSMCGCFLYAWSFDIGDFNSEVFNVLASGE